MSFLSPGLLWGLTLLSVPILIHLLNKRKFRIVEWAPMKHLRLTITKTRRRIRLEQLMLLLVRCAFVAGVVLALTRPTIREDGLLNWASTGARTSRAFLLDDTLSMGLSFGAETSFTLGKQALRKLLDHQSPADLVSVLLASRPQEPALASTEARQLTDVAGLLDSLEPTAMTHLWSEAVREAGDHLLRTPYPVRELVIITDLRAEGYTDNLISEADRLALSGIKFKIVDVGGLAVGNLALLDLVPPDGAVVPRLQTVFKARIRNDGDDLYGPFTATLAAEGASRIVMIPAIEPGTVAEVTVEWRFDQTGSQVISLELPPDCLLADNRRLCSVDVREALDLHLVDGDPSNEAFESETDFLQVAFTIGDVPWRVYGFTDAEWLSAPPADTGLLILANVSHLTEERVRWLEERVRAGMGLIIFPGEQTDLAEWDRLLFRGGEGLLPCPLGDVETEAIKGVMIESVERSPLAVLQTVAPEALAEVHVQSYLGVRWTDSERARARVLARWNHEQASPAMLQRTFGEGQVVLMTTSADRSWTDWPVDPTWLLMIRELGISVVSRGTADLNGEAGQLLTIDTGLHKALDGMVLPPSAEEAEAMRTTVGEDRRHGLEWRVARGSGVYRVTWTGEDGGEEKRSLAINGAAVESNLQRIEDKELQRSFGRAAPEAVHHTAIEKILTKGGREIWRSLAWMALALLGVGSLYMVWVGRRG